MQCKICGQPANNRYELCPKCHDGMVGHFSDIPTLRLANAAPELLEACKASVAALTQNATFTADIEFCKRVLSAAIAKAEGR